MSTHKFIFNILWQKIYISYNWKWKKIYQTTGSKRRLRIKLQTLGFLWSIAVSSLKSLHTLSKNSKQMHMERKYNHPPLILIAQLGDSMQCIKLHV